MSRDMLDFTPHLPRLHGYARRLTRDRANTEDLVQDTVLRALEKAHLFQHDTNLRGWLITIMHNEHVNRARHLKRTPFAALKDDELSSAGCGESQTASVEFREMQHAVARLSPEQREPLLLYWIEGYKYEEVAERLGVPLGTVQSRISRARKTLRALIADPRSRLGLGAQAAA
jgi:RNA polymerase sigma-70 factor (ECF subfamily)